MRDEYTEQESERFFCFICDYWWAILLALLLIGTGWYFRDQWIPLITGDSPTTIPDLGTGDIQVTLTWNSTNDIDLWVTDPAGDDIYYNQRFSASGGELDVDANPGCQHLTSQPIENIYWPTGQAPHGTYTVQVNYYQQCEENASVDFQIRLEVDGEVTEFNEVISQEGETVPIITFSR